MLFDLGGQLEPLDAEAQAAASAPAAASANDAATIVALRAEIERLTAAGGSVIVAHGKALDLAEAEELDLRTVTPTGKNGAISVDDVRAAMAARDARVQLVVQLTVIRVAEPHDHL